MGQYSHIQSQWVTLGGKKSYYRSGWEALYARWLDWQQNNGWIDSWEHEPKTFWFDGIRRGTCSYKPDFLVRQSSESWHWVEVKGHMDSRSLTKIKRFRKYYPEEPLRVIDAKWFRENERKLNTFIGTNGKKTIH